MAERKSKYKNKILFLYFLFLFSPRSLHSLSLPLSLTLPLSFPLSSCVVADAKERELYADAQSCDVRAALEAVSLERYVRSSPTIDLEYWNLFFCVQMSFDLLMKFICYLFLFIYLFLFVCLAWLYLSISLFILIYSFMYTRHRDELLKAVSQLKAGK